MLNEKKKSYLWKLFFLYSLKTSLGWRILFFIHAVFIKFSRNFFFGQLVSMQNNVKYGFFSHFKSS